MKRRTFSPSSLRVSSVESFSRARLDRCKQEDKFRPPVSTRSEQALNLFRNRGSADRGDIVAVRRLIEQLALNTTGPNCDQVTGHSLNFADYSSSRCGGVLLGDDGLRDR